MINIVNWLRNPPTLADKIFREAGFHPDHGRAVQRVADRLERIVSSRCAATHGIQLLEEGYASKGFGIKAKSCDWGPFNSFVLAHVQFAKFAEGATPAAIAKQQKEFDSAKKGTGFTASDFGGPNQAMALANAHSSMAGEEILMVSTNRLNYLRSIGEIYFHRLIAGERVYCRSPWGWIYFVLVDMTNGAPDAARWAFLHSTTKKWGVQAGQMSFVKAMKNLSPGGRSVDRYRQSCTGDYDLWGIFPKMNSSVKSTASLARHGMDRQMTLVPTLAPGAGAGIKKIMSEMKNRIHDNTHERNHHIYGKYKEDREKGNVSALTLHTARALNREIKLAGYKGGDMFHHNDDMGNPFRGDVEEEVIAFVPGCREPYFIQSKSNGATASVYKRGLGPVMCWNEFVETYEKTYHFYDNLSIHRYRGRS